MPLQTAPFLYIVHYMKMYYLCLENIMLSNRLLLSFLPFLSSGARAFPRV